MSVNSSQWENHPVSITTPTLPLYSQKHKQTEKDKCVNNTPSLSLSLTNSFFPLSETSISLTLSFLCVWNQLKKKNGSHKQRHHHRAKHVNLSDISLRHRLLPLVPRQTGISMPEGSEGAVARHRSFPPRGFRGGAGGVLLPNLVGHVALSIRAVSPHRRPHSVHRFHDNSHQ